MSDAQVVVMIHHAEYRGDHSENMETCENVPESMTLGTLMRKHAHLRGRTGCDAIWITIPDQQWPAQEHRDD